MDDDRFRIPNYPDMICRSPIEASLASRMEMSLGTFGVGASGVACADGDPGEPAGVEPARGDGRSRGRPGNRQHGDSFRRTVLDLVRERYPDFGPTLAAAKLAERHGLRLGVETLRQWMIEDGIRLRRRDRPARVQQPRDRRDCLGEPVQIDGSERWWFEDRGPQCTLLVYIDDATSRLMLLRFVESEAAFDCFKAPRSHRETHGRPVALYSDKHGIFRIAGRGAVQGDGMTRFGRALHALNIDILCAGTPQAKGRVERAGKTLRDRLVKALRRRGIDTIDAGNAMPPAFMADHNGRFAKAPKDARAMHRPVPSTDDVDTAFSRREERTVSHSLTLQYDKMPFLPEPSGFARAPARKRVLVHDCPATCSRSADRDAAAGTLIVRCAARSPSTLVLRAPAARLRG